MPSDPIIFAGVEISSGRKPVTFAALDGELNIVSLEKRDISGMLSSLKEQEDIFLAINLPVLDRDQEIHSGFKKQITRAGFKPYSRKNGPQQWFETSAQDCFRKLIEQNLLSRRTFEGRLQRTLVLYDHGVQIDDPMEIFEEITRYKLMQGILLLKNTYTSKELDALMAAYMAWRAINRPDRVIVEAGMLLPGSE